MTYQNIKTATAIYTGGGIYIYYGQLDNGLYFRACDGWNFISICNADTSSEAADYCEFYDEFEQYALSDDRFKTAFNSMLRWIINNKPDGNYCISELENRILL
jgi:hypothetical protein